MNYCIIIASVLISSAFGQELFYPGERCTILNEDYKDICYDCTTIIDCNSYKTSPTALTSCADGLVCTTGIDGYGRCITSTSSESPICMCESLGCFQDPFNREYYGNCYETDTAISTVPRCSRSPPQVLDVLDCQCDYVECPPCGWLPTDTSDCPVSYYDCNDQITSHETFHCNTDLCFNVTTCSCQTPQPQNGCPACGKYSDPFVLDGSGFCICGDGIEDVCGLSCADGFTFDSKSCMCTDGTVTETAEPRTTASSTTLPAITCLECGLVKAPGSECNKYYSCSANNEITNTYYCPGDQCFNEAVCHCV